MMILKQNNKMLVGVDRENIIRLTKGEPIIISGDRIDIDMDIYIAFGETLQDIIDELGLGEEIARYAKEHWTEN